MQAIIDLFTWQVFVAFGVPVTFLELVGFVTGAACVFAVAMQWTWNWPVAIVNAIAFAFLFFNVGLYADAFLQLIFLALSVYGWYKWTLGKPKDVVKLPVRWATTKEIMILGPLTVLALIGVAAFLHTQTDSDVFVFDAAILTLSILATYGQAKKIIQSWWVWITVDVISIPLYFYKGLALTGLLYVIFLALCIKGLYEWNKDLKAQEEDGEWINPDDMRVKPVDNPLDFRPDGSIRAGDPAYDARMEVMNDPEARPQIFNQNKNGTWTSSKWDKK